MNILLSIILIIVISFLFLNLTNRLKIPSVVSLIVIGIFLTLPGFREIFVGKNEEIIYHLGNFGLFSLMFLAGLGSSLRVLKKEEKDSFYLALFGALIPFSLGFIVFYFLGFSLVVSTVIGLCMSITAEATKAQVLLELGKLKTRVGSAMIGAGIIDDLFGLIGFSILMYFLGVLTFEEHFILFGVLASFFIGLYVQKYFREHHITKNTEIILNFILVPFFFISMGISFDLLSLFVSFKYLFLIILVALIGKMLGIFISKPFVNFSYKQLYLMGWAMNSRGAIELALALLAFRLNLINSEIYSSLVIMALVTTIIFPFMITSLSKNDKFIFN